MRTAIAILLAAAFVPVLLTATSPAQEGTAEKIGRRLDEGLERLSEGVQEAWTDVRAKVDKLGVQGRVYGRLRWDKALADEPIDVDMQTKEVVVLTGRVPDNDTREKAVRLAQDTVGVSQVVDRLRIEPRSVSRPMPEPGK